MTPPQRTGAPLVPVSITGYVMPVRQNGQPMMLRMPDSDKLYIPVFRTKAQLETLWKLSPQIPAFDRVMVIDNGMAFLASIRENKNPNLVVIANLRMLDNQRVKFTQIFQEGDELPPGNPS